jgi:Co/Zn/Cd efflux system component
MSWAGMLGIFAHGVCIYYLFQYRTGDSNRLSVWICTINDLVSNILTVIASQLVKLTDSIYPDIIAAALIVAIAIYGAIIILRQAIKELKLNRPIESYE